MPSAKADLRELAMDRSAPQGQHAAPQRSRVLTRVVLPGLILTGFAGLIFAAAREQFLPRKSVTVVPVMVTNTSAKREGTALFQTAGWVEPRPSAVNVAALATGVVEEVLVVGGTDVTAGQPVARLVKTDAELALQRADVARKLQAAELESAEVELRAARLRKENPVHLRAALADAQAALSKTESEVARIPFQIETAAAQLAYAEENLRGKESAGDTIAGRLLQQARSERNAADANLREWQDQKRRLEAERVAQAGRVEVFQQQLDLLIDETRQVEAATAQLHAAQARLDQAILAVSHSQLMLDRTTITAPVTGRVLAVLARPGTRVTDNTMGEAASSSTILTLYDPAQLQVRADVRLENVRDIQPGMQVRITSASLAQPLNGQVLQATSSANIQKNTLEVKVAIDDPPPELRPEMIVSATFLAPASEAGPEDVETIRLLVPRRLVDAESGSPAVWTVDAEGRARRCPITLGEGGDDSHAEVTAGLNPGDKLVDGGRESLVDGSRVTITGETNAD